MISIKVEFATQFDRTTHFGASRSEKEYYIRSKACLHSIKCHFWKKFEFESEHTHSMEWPGSFDRTPKEKSSIHESERRHSIEWLSAFS